jgi:hypothetical protein
MLLKQIKNAKLLNLKCISSFNLLVPSLSKTQEFKSLKKFNILLFRDHCNDTGSYNTSKAII